MPRRPPKEWFYYVVAELEKRPEVTDPKALAGWLWHHWMKPETKTAILRAEGKLDPEKLKVRKGLIKTPKVIRYKDHKGGSGLIRVLEREDGSLFPEFALYPRHSKTIIKSLKFAGLKEESKGKWVLRTNKFSVFVYV